MALLRGPLGSTNLTAELFGRSPDQVVSMSNSLREEARMSYEMPYGPSEFESAPPPLPRLSGGPGGPGGSRPPMDTRIDRPSETPRSASTRNDRLDLAAEMAFADQRIPSAAASVASVQSPRTTTAFAYAMQVPSSMPPVPPLGLLPAQALALDAASWSTGHHLHLGRNAGAHPAMTSGLAAEMKLPQHFATSEGGSRPPTPRRARNEGYLAAGMANGYGAHYTTSSSVPYNMDPYTNGGVVHHPSQSSSAAADLTTSKSQKLLQELGGPSQPGDTSKQVPPPGFYPNSQVESAVEGAMEYVYGTRSSRGGHAGATAEHERSSRSRSVTPARTLYANGQPVQAWSSMSPMPALTPMRPTSITAAGMPMTTTISAAAPYGCPAVWPPPPLPPVNSDLAARLEALESQKAALGTLDTPREKRLEELQTKLSSAQATASQCKELEQQLEKCNADWKRKFDELEARWKEEEESSARRVEEAAALAEKTVRENIERLQKELQTVRSEGDRAVEEAQRRGQEEIDKLKRELRLAGEAEERSNTEASRRDTELLQLRSELERENQRFQDGTTQLRRLEQRAQDLEEELRKERSSSKSRDVAVEEQARSSEVQLQTLRRDAEDLRGKLREVTADRDQLGGDVQSLRKANEQRETECKSLRKSISDEKEQIRYLQATIPAGMDSFRAASFERFDSRRSEGSLRLQQSGEMPLPRASQTIAVDLTDDGEVGISNNLVDMR